MLCELKNIATYEKDQGKGYAGKLINHVISYYKGKFRAMFVGTGDVPWIIQFYEKHGFKTSHSISCRTSLQITTTIRCLKTVFNWSI